MNALFNPKTRIVTFNAKGRIEEKDSTGSTIGALDNANVDGVIFVSTDAASKITERAIGIAFDKWASDFLKQDPQNTSGSDKEKEKVTTLPSNGESTQELKETQVQSSNSKSALSKNKTKDKNPVGNLPKGSVSAEDVSKA